MKDFQDFVKEESETLKKSQFEDDYKTFIDKNEQDLEKKFGIIMKEISRKSLYYNHTILLNIKNI